MKGHKAHSEHKGVVHAGVHHKHPRAEHKKGGKVNSAEHPMEGHFDEDEAPKEVYAGAGSNVVKEAEEKKRGGRTKRKHGGHVMKHMGHVHGEHAKHRADRPARKRGGKAMGGSNMNPLSSAHKGTEPSGHHSYEPEEMGK